MIPGAPPNIDHCHPQHWSRGRCVVCASLIAGLESLPENCSKLRSTLLSMYFYCIQFMLPKSGRAGRGGDQNKSEWRYWICIFFLSPKMPNSSKCFLQKILVISLWLLSSFKWTLGVAQNICLRGIFLLLFYISYILKFILNLMGWHWLVMYIVSSAQFLNTSAL